MNKNRVSPKRMRNHPNEDGHDWSGDPTNSEKTTKNLKNSRNGAAVPRETYAVVPPSLSPPPRPKILPRQNGVVPWIAPWLKPQGNLYVQSIPREHWVDIIGLLLSVL